MAYSFAFFATLYSAITLANQIGYAKVDTNGDGMSDVWFSRLDLGEECPACGPLNDNDGDGFNNLEESIGGTDPLWNSNSERPDFIPGYDPNVIYSGGLPSQLEFRWYDKPYKKYQVYGLLIPEEGGFWENVSPQSIGNGGSVKIEIIPYEAIYTTNTGNYRLQIWDAVDTDGDGLDDWEDTQLGGNRFLTDTDGDTLNDLTEWQIGTTLWKSDSEGDGLPDGWEVQYGLSPFSGSGNNGANGDPDNDGLTNLQEYQGGTNPIVSNFVDTDSDGMDDNWEIQYWGNLNQTAAGDPDNDGLSNLQEYQGGTNPIVFTLVDTDSDGLHDNWEIQYWGNLNQTATGDPDNDCLDNLTEYLGGTNPIVINPGECGSGTGTGPFIESGGMIVIEAENFDNNIPRNGKSWDLKTTHGSYSGTGYMEALPNTGLNQDTGYAANSPELQYQVSFITAGNYHVWFRAYITSGSDDSFHAGINDNAPYPSTSDRLQPNSPNNQWNWSKDTRDGTNDARINISAGADQTLNFWMREDGSKIDKILLTLNAGYTPTGTGPAESSRDGGSSSGSDPLLSDIPNLIPPVYSLSATGGVSPPAAADTFLWNNFTATEEDPIATPGWFNSTWFGWIYAGEYPWIWSDNMRLWFNLLTDTPPDPIWMWNDQLGWLWTDNTNYPWIWGEDQGTQGGAWLWYDNTNNQFWNDDPQIEDWFQYLADSDDDNILDSWENFYFDPTLPVNVLPGIDSDGDGLTNLQEFQIGSDPTVNIPDNDSDGLKDSWELTYFPTITGQNGNDDSETPSSDSLTNHEEFLMGTDPSQSGLDDTSNLLQLDIFKPEE